jgi:outer membrane murein-binding lipoprotein Lpp
MTLRNIILAAIVPAALFAGPAVADDRPTIPGQLTCTVEKQTIANLRYRVQTRDAKIAELREKLEQARNR